MWEPMNLLRYLSILFLSIYQQFVIQWFRYYVIETCEIICNHHLEERLEKNPFINHLIVARTYGSDIKSVDFAYC